MAKIIVNASGAKTGGAKTIVETFCRWLEKHDHSNFYIFIVGFPLETTSKNIKVISLATNGITSLLFTTIGVSYYCLKFRTNIVLSFMNMNAFPPFIKRITYFHQALLFSSDIPKFRIYKVILKLQKNSFFITQTELIQNQLSNLLKINTVDNSITTIWPGITIPDILVAPDWYNINEFKGYKIALCPYSSITFDYKNFDKIYNSYCFFKKNKIKVIVTTTTDQYEDNDVFNFVGNCILPELHFLYKESDVILFPSKNETVGLPIFESLYHGTPVIVEDVDYVRNIINKFPYLNIIIDKNSIYNIDINSIQLTEYAQDEDCFEGEWDKLLQLINSLN